MKKKILFIINPIAGVKSKHRVPDKIERFLDMRKFEYDIYYTQGRGHAAELAANAASQGVDVVAIGGGDGSVNEAAGSLVDTDTALAILPLGSGNGLASHLGYTSWIESTLTVINAFTFKEIDVGVVNGKFFFSLIGIGFDAYVAKLFDRESTRGFATYAMTSLRSLFSFKDFEYQLESPACQMEGKGFIINICNSNQYGYNVKVAPEADLFDGLFDIVVLRDYPRYLSPELIWRLFKGTHLDSRYISYFKTSSLKIRTSRRTYLQIDGETQHKAMDYKIHLHNKKLKVLVNPYQKTGLWEKNVMTEEE